MYSVVRRRGTSFVRRLRHTRQHKCIMERESKRLLPSFREIQSQKSDGVIIHWAGLGWATPVQKPPVHLYRRIYFLFPPPSSHIHNRPDSFYTPFYTTRPSLSLSLSLSFFIDVYFHSLAAVQKRTALLAQTATSCLCLGERQGGREKRPQIPRDETATTTPATLVLRCCCDFFDPRVLPSFMWYITAHTLLLYILYVGSSLCTASNVPLVYSIFSEIPFHR